MTDLRMALVQRAASLDPRENRDALDKVGPAIEEGTALVLLPEAFARDFGTPGTDSGEIAAFAERLDGPFVTAVTAFAERHDTTVVAGMFEVGDDPDRPFNTLVVVDGGGLRASYRKIHLYDSFGYRESDRFSAGPLTPVCVDVDGLTVGLMTCYDLRFPELSRALVAQGAGLLVAPSAWVAGPGKVDHWRTLVAARAIENTVYVAAVGQPGPRYTGHSLVVGPTGTLVAEVGDGEHVVTASIASEAIDDARAENPSLANRRL